MCLRISSLLLASGILAGCGTQTPEPEGAALECAIGPGADLAPICTLEWIGQEWEGDFIIHHPGGAFRRFTLEQGPIGIVTVDGADAIEMLDTPSDDAWLFSVSGDRYRLPLPPPPHA